ncbi:cilia- and flagella-associated protein 44-like isoform X2 [Antedon mediterranea]|uniref:cilia- and flagella-associated protein 44-like isoform X2 n=1 Tax=Antedon mediterranea TaxID=105859 RepID=UPI003AF84EA1
MAERGKHEENEENGDVESGTNAEGSEHVLDTTSAVGPATSADLENTGENLEVDKASKTKNPDAGDSENDHIENGDHSATMEEKVVDIKLAKTAKDDDKQAGSENTNGEDLNSEKEDLSKDKNTSEESLENVTNDGDATEQANNNNDTLGNAEEQTTSETNQDDRTSLEANTNVNNSADGEKNENKETEDSTADQENDQQEEESREPVAESKQEQDKNTDGDKGKQESVPATEEDNKNTDKQQEQSNVSTTEAKNEEDKSTDGADGGAFSKGQKSDSSAKDAIELQEVQQESFKESTNFEEPIAETKSSPAQEIVPEPSAGEASTAAATEGDLQKDDQQPDEGSVEPEEAREQDEDKIPSQFYYDSSELQSTAKVAEDSGLPLDLLKIHHSFGYDCLKHHNLLMLDANTIIFIAGNMVQLLDITTNEQKYIRSTSGGGIGAIAVHPSGKYFAVAEKGVMPNINIYEFPSLKLYRILREGTETAYAHIDFNPSGSLLASVGSSPDFMLTVWNWADEVIMLRSKAFSQDVFRVTFSPDNEGQLTTSGIGHIRFWKMAHTFTGLKLQGQLGKFGRTAISDIRGYIELPDGKVLSGTEWGNMLLWDGGLIKVEIARKHKKNCHTGPIEQFVMDEGELITIGADGFIRVWDFESIDTADSHDDSGIFEMEPMNELKVGNGVHLRSMIKSVDPEAQSIWFAQDANGAIWKLDLSFSHTTKDPDQLFSFHSGVITEAVSSGVSHLVATTGDDCTVRVYDYSSKSKLCQTRFNSGGTSLLWIPDIIDPKGRTILAGFEDGVVRVLTVSKRDPNDTTPVKRQSIVTNAQLLLKQAFKPQSSKVTSMAIDSKGEFLSTGGSDSTVFFMTVGDVYKPIGFVDVPGPVTHLTWSPPHFDKNTLLVFCANGEVVEIEAPDSDTYDTSKTFRLKNVKMRNATFKSVKSKLRRKEEEKRKEEEMKKKREEEERQRRIRRERGIESDEEDEEKEEEEEQLPPLYVPDEPNSIHCGFYSTHDPNKFWVSMGSYDAGYLYECDFPDEKKNLQLKREDREDDIGDPCQAVPVTDSNDVPIRNITFSKNGQQVIFGFEDGSIRIQSINQDGLKFKPNTSHGDLTGLGPYWTLNVHDNNYGEVTSVATSMDDRYIFTTGTDGNFFVYRLMTQEQIEEAKAIAKAKIPSARKEDIERKVDDIENKDHYSIEVEKQKAEHDRMMKLAEEKKMNVRRTIARLRRQFKKLLESNADLPEHLQLERMEFEMDPEIKKDMERQTAQRIELVRKELAWESDKHQIALDKLKKRFKNELECERITVISIQSSHEVSTFRTSELSEDFYQLKADMVSRQATRMTERGLSRDPTREALLRQAKRSESESDTMIGIGAQDHKKTMVLTGRLGEKVANALQKAERIKKKREARKAQWVELHEHKPPEDYEDPDDIRAIKEAQEHMGDFKLKTAKDYVVPEHLRMNAHKKLNQLIILKELLHEHKYEFNQKVIGLRNKKVRMITDIKGYIQDLVELQKEMPMEQHKPLPTCPDLHPCEVPEKKFEYTRESLLKFKEEMAVRAVNEIKGIDSGGFGGFGGFGGGAAPPPPEPMKQESATPTKIGTPKQIVSSMSVRSGVSVENISSPGKELSVLEQQLLKVKEIRVLYRQDTILKKIDELIRNFDAELRILRHYKFKEDIDLKNADLRHVTLFEELQLLKEFEKSENVLAAKVESKENEKEEMQIKVAECKAKLDAKRKDIDRLHDKEKALYAQFQASLGENNKFAEFLTKVFKKKIKRAKKKALAEDGASDDESEESSDDDSDWSSEEEDSDEDGLDDSVCPPGCDQALFDNTCALREKRLDFEELLAEEKKTADALKKETDTLNRKQKIIDNALSTAEGDLEAFQLEKQQKLNELDIVVTLKLHQVEHVVNGSLPQDLSSTLVFTNNSMVRLQRRITELKEEKTAQRRLYKEHRQQHVRLIKERKLMETRIVELEEQCKESMIQKFGCVVDLEKIETLGVNRNIEELKERIRQNEVTNTNDLQKWQEKIESKKDRITELTRENTEAIRHLTMLLGENKGLEKALDSRQKTLGGEFQGSRKADLEEKQRLIQLVQLQAQEIEALKEEISLLSRKGGHILPPTQPPMPPTPHNRQVMSSNGPS